MPLASTVAAGVVGRKAIKWTDPVINFNPDFSLKDPYVTRNATFADLMSHRGGLGTGSGDLLEDLGFDRSYILAHLNQQPLDTFRTSYHYSNFGYTEGGQAVADAMKMSWEDLADEILFKPLGMSSTSYRHADALKTTHTPQTTIRPDCSWGTPVPSTLATPPPWPRCRGSSWALLSSLRAHLRPAHALSACTGSYANSFYGPLTIGRVDGKLTLSMGGPAGRTTTFQLTHYDGERSASSPSARTATALPALSLPRRMMARRRV